MRSAPTGPTAQPTQVPRQPTQASHMPIAHPQMNIPTQFSQGAFGPRPGYQQATSIYSSFNPTTIKYILIIFFQFFFRSNFAKKS